MWLTLVKSIEKGFIEILPLSKKVTKGSGMAEYLPIIAILEDVL